MSVVNRTTPKVIRAITEPNRTRNDPFYGPRPGEGDCKDQRPRGSGLGQQGRFYKGIEGSSCKNDGDKQWNDQRF